jgi:hypothetical protein
VTAKCLRHPSTARGLRRCREIAWSFIGCILLMLEICTIKNIFLKYRYDAKNIKSKELAIWLGT